MSKRLQVQVVSDFLCPFCRVACERASWLESEYDAEIEWLPWDLHPEYPAEGIPRSELVAKYGAEHFANVAQMFADCDFTYAPHPERVPNTQLALELGELARSADLHAEYHDAVMVAMWEQERDVADPAVLGEVSIGIGRSRLPDFQLLSTAWVDCWSLSPGPPNLFGVAALPTHMPISKGHSPSG